MKKLLRNEEVMKKNLRSYEESFSVIHKTHISVKLFPSMIKKDNFEWVLQKCTELGVDEFHPIVSQRTVKTNINMDRAEKIIKEASEQSERNTLPRLFPIETLEQAILENHDRQCFFLDVTSVNTNVSQIRDKEEVFIFIGPEGGWGEKDLALFEKYNVKSFSINQNTLRAETASIAISSLLLCF